MDRKKWLLPIGMGVLAAMLFLLLLTGEEQAPAAGPTLMEPSSQSQTIPKEPALTTAPETTPSAPSAPAGTTEPPRTGPQETQAVPTGPEPTQTPTSAGRELFPLELEGGRLIAQSLFRFSGMNPDCDDLFGEDIAGLQMTNTSDEHMAFAEVTVILTEGKTLTFRAEDVPPGGTVMAFCLEHESVTDPDSCEEAFGYAEFCSGDMLLSDQLEITVEGARITLRNLSGEDLTDLKVICHGLLDGSLFGGSTYQYHVSTLPAGASADVYAVDCILGMTEVVRVVRGG